MSNGLSMSIVTLKPGKFLLSQISIISDISLPFPPMNLFDPTNYLYVQGNIYLDSTNYLHLQLNNYFDSTNYLYIQRITYIFNERIIFIQPTKYIYSTSIFSFNQIVIKYMVNEI